MARGGERGDSYQRGRSKIDHLLYVCPPAGRPDLYLSHECAMCSLAFRSLRQSHPRRRSYTHCAPPLLCLFIHPPPSPGRSVGGTGKRREGADTPAFRFAQRMRSTFVGYVFRIFPSLAHSTACAPPGGACSTCFRKSSAEVRSCQSRRESNAGAAALSGE